jgi:hypothetical protein
MSSNPFSALPVFAVVPGMAMNHITSSNAGLPSSLNFGFFESKSCCWRLHAFGLDANAPMRVSPIELNLTNGSPEPPVSAACAM